MNKFDVGHAVKLLPGHSDQDSLKAKALHHKQVQPNTTGYVIALRKRSGYEYLVKFEGIDKARTCCESWLSGGAV